MFKYPKSFILHKYLMYLCARERIKSGVNRRETAAYDLPDPCPTRKSNHLVELIESVIG